MVATAQPTTDRGIGASRPLSLRTNFAWTMAGNAFASASGLAIISLLAKLGSATMVGQYTLGITVGAIVLAVPELGLRSVQATDARRTHRFGHYLALRLAGLGVAWPVIALVALLGGYGPTAALAVCLVGTATCVGSLADVIYGLLQQNEQMDRIAISMIAKACLSVIGVGAALALTGSIIAACAALIFVAGAVLVFYDLRSARFVLSRAEPSEGDRPPRVRPRWEAAALKSLAVLALPLGLTTLLIGLNTHASRLVIVGYLGERSLGIFSAAAQITLAGNMVLTALGNAAAPRLAKHFARLELRPFLGLFGKLMALASGIGVAMLVFGWLAGRFVLTVLYTPEYAEHLDVFLWLVGASAIYYISTTFGVGLTVARKMTVQLVVGILSVATAIGASLLLVPTHGLVGAGIAAAATAVVRLLGLGLAFGATLLSASRSAGAATRTGRAG